MNVNKIRWASGAQMLDVVELTRFERGELFAILGITLSVFINNGKTFHPSHMVIAVERAMKTCVADRRARIEKEHPLIMAQLRTKGVLGFLKFWWPGVFSELDIIVNADEDKRSRAALDAKAARLERHSLLKARRRCSTSTATMDEFQEALHLQHQHIERKEEQLFGHKEVPQVFLPSHEHGANPAHKASISMGPNGRGTSKPRASGLSQEAEGLERARLQNLDMKQGSGQDFIRRAQKVSPVELDRLMMDQSAEPLKVEQLEAQSQLLQDEAVKLQTRKNRLQEELRAVKAQLGKS